MVIAVLPPLNVVPLPVSNINSTFRIWSAAMVSMIVPILAAPWKQLSVLVLPLMYVVVRVPGIKVDPPRVSLWFTTVLVPS